ncbi:ACT domain-containing protein [uncultured Methanobrevibacter sp.]|uniref:ACT domain-containing protein n=1 Tax=uncultured Methanobrevibacter sp. TaxID=253161 RepID=UPI0025E421A4|nr:ACT domain-containing protein [uncultured Methanobrevibacter sp.]
MEKVKQLSIFLTNQKGKLYNVLNILKENNINIRALSLTDTSEFGILRLIVDCPDKGKELLEKNNYTIKISSAIAVELSDTPGGLSSVLKILNDNNINLDYIYAFTHEYSDKAILFLSTHDLDLLITVLKENSIEIVPSDEIYNL